MFLANLIGGVLKKWFLKKVATILLASFLISLVSPSFSLHKNPENTAKAAATSCETKKAADYADFITGLTISSVEKGGTSVIVSFEAVVNQRQQTSSSTIDFSLFRSKGTEQLAQIVPVVPRVSTENIKSGAYSGSTRYFADYEDKTATEKVIYNYQVKVTGMNAGNQMTRICSNQKSIDLSSGAGTGTGTGAGGTGGATSSTFPPCPSNIKMVQDDTQRNRINMTWDWGWDKIPAGESVTFIINMSETPVAPSSEILEDKDGSDTDKKATVVMPDATKVNGYYTVTAKVGTKNSVGCSGFTFGSSVGVITAGECETAIPGYGIAVYLQRSFCGLALLLRDFADSLLEKAFAQLKNALGYTDTSTAPGSSSGFSGGSVGGTGSGGGGGGGGW